MCLVYCFLKFDVCARPSFSFSLFPCDCGLIFATPEGAGSKVEERDKGVACSSGKK